MTGVEWGSILKRKFIFEQNSSLYNQKYTWYYQSKTPPKRKGDEFLISSRMAKRLKLIPGSSAIHLEGWTRHFGHEYVI